MVWSWFRRASDESEAEASWWRDADAVALVPTRADVDRLTAAVRGAAAAADERDRQEEMIEGLEQLLALAGAPLPEIDTQHRVIGADRCHLITPVSLADPSGASGKLFVTSARLVFVAADVRAWPWHRVRDVSREDRTIVVVLAGGPEPIAMRCNTYGDALAAWHLAGRLRRA